MNRNAKQNSFGLMSPQPENKQPQPPQNKSSMVGYDTKGRSSSIQNGEEAKISQINKDRDKLNSSINDIKGTYDELKLA